MESLWYIKHCQLFAELTGQQLAELERHALLRRFAAGSLIYLPEDQADGVLLLAEGRVKLCSHTPDGKQAILAFIEPGEVFGELALIGESQREEFAQAVTAATVFLLPGEALEQLMADSTQLTLGITRLIGWRRKRIERRLKTLLFRSNRDRVIHLLLDLAEQYGQTTPDGVALAIRLSHQDMAAIIGATRETVTVLLGELQLEGLLKVARRKLVIRDLHRLAECVEVRAPRVPEAARPAYGRPPTLNVREV